MGDGGGGWGGGRDGGGGWRMGVGVGGGGWGWGWGVGVGVGGGGRGGAARMFPVTPRPECFPNHVQLGRTQVFICCFLFIPFNIPSSKRVFGNSTILHTQHPQRYRQVGYCTEYSLVTWGSQGHGARSGNSDSCFPPFDRTPMFSVVLGDRCSVLQSKIHEQKLIFLRIGMVDFQTQQGKSAL